MAAHPSLHAPGAFLFTTSKLAADVRSLTAASPPFRMTSLGARVLAFVDLPIAFGVKAHLEQAIFGVVALAATWTDEIAAPGGALMVVVFGDGEGASATAGDEEHPQVCELLLFLR